MIDLLKRINRRIQLRQQAQPKPLRSGIHPMPLPLKASSETPWQPCHFFNGLTPNRTMLSCHASALAHGHCPHPPHAHEEEELLLVLAGEVEIILPALNSADERSQRLQAGEFVYYPALFPHTLRTLSEEPANYLMFKWTADTTGGKVASRMAFTRSRLSQPDREDPRHPGYFSELLFAGPTEHLAKLHCHMTRLAPGGGYPAHEDRHDVAIVLLEGECESLGQNVDRNSVLFYAAGEPHGMSNTGATEVNYLVFEFHPVVRRPSIWRRLFPTRRKAG
jgi:quercetin dioxygenase-like cupin family protein